MTRIVRSTITNMKNLMRGLMIGAVLGVTAGLLLAPRSGEKTRRRLIKGSMRLKESVVDYIDNSIDRLRDQFNSKIDTLAARGKNTINHVTERIKV